MLTKEKKKKTGHATFERSWHATADRPPCPGDRHQPGISDPEHRDRFGKHRGSHTETITAPGRKARSENGVVQTGDLGQEAPGAPAPATSHDGRGTRVSRRTFVDAAASRRRAQ
ncbi:uncharacterized protein LOC144135063 [Amblyomma americanum]